MPIDVLSVVERDDVDDDRDSYPKKRKRQGHEA